MNKSKCSILTALYQPSRLDTNCRGSQVPAVFPKILAHTSFSKVFIKIEVRASGPRSLSFLRTDCSGSYTALFKHWGIHWSFKGWWNIGLSPFTPEPTRRPQILSGPKLLFMLRQKKSFCTWQWFIIKRWLSFIVWPCSLGCCCLAFLCF